MTYGKFRGIVSDILGSLDEHKTRWYGTYFEAHKAAEKLAKRHYTAGRATIDVESANENEERVEE